MDLIRASLTDFEIPHSLHNSDKKSQQARERQPTLGGDSLLPHAKHPS